jgi:cbb3-type cytochrome oxidase subunit 3
MGNVKSRLIIFYFGGLNMRKVIFYIPAIIFAILYGLLAISDIGAISPIIVVWLALFFIGGLMLHKNFFGGSLFGALPAIHLIYMGTQQTGQIFNEAPIGIVILIFYLLCGYFVYRSNKEAITN